jgi:hypothetical protein
MAVERDNNKLSAMFNKSLDDAKKNNSLPERRYKSKTESLGDEMIKDAKDQGLTMEVDNS